MNTGVITGVSIAHQRATVEEIEAAAREDTKTRLETLLLAEPVEEAFALQTCNRVEAYVVTAEPRTGRDVLAEHFEYEAVSDDATLWMNHEESLRHLLSVASGLESLVLGEDQIIGQVREAYETARGVGALGYVLEDAVLKAVHVGERARSETKINEGVVSLGSAAVELAARKCSIEDASALVVGAGEMGVLAARALDDAGVERLTVANRTIPHADYLAKEVDVDAAAIGLDELPEATASADVVITATGSNEPVIDARTFEDGASEGGAFETGTFRDGASERGTSERETFDIGATTAEPSEGVAIPEETVVIDVAQPRDVAPEVADLDGVDVYDLDALESVTARTRQRRESAAREVEAMVEEELERLLEGFKRKRADEAIATMYESAERVKSRELSRAVSALEARGDLTDEQRASVEALADALIGQLLAAPTKSLREAAAEDDWTTISTALRLFDPEFNTDGLEGVAPERSTEPTDLPASGVADAIEEDD